MKRYILIALAAASTTLVGCAGNLAGANTQSSAAAQPQPPPKGWVCPMHGPSCPWVTKQRYCNYYDQHGYGSWRGGNCCSW